MIKVCDCVCQDAATLKNARIAACDRQETIELALGACRTTRIRIKQQLFLRFLNGLTRSGSQSATGRIKMKVACRLAITQAGHARYEQVMSLGCCRLYKYDGQERGSTASTSQGRSSTAGDGQAGLAVFNIG